MKITMDLGSVQKFGRFHEVRDQKATRVTERNEATWKGQCNEQTLGNPLKQKIKDDERTNGWTMESIESKQRKKNQILILAGVQKKISWDTDDSYYTVAVRVCFSKRWYAG